MKLPKYLVAVILLYLAVETQCGVIDNIFGRVRNTTNALRQDVKNVVNYSKSVVGIETPVDNRPEDERRGLIGGMVHTTRRKMHNFRNYFWNTDAGATDAGMFGNMYNRVLTKLSKVKGALLGDDGQPRPLTDQEKIVQKTLEKLFAKNGTRQVHGQAFQKAIDNLRQYLHDMRNNITKVKETPVHHGEGLIDVRLAPVSAENIHDDNTHSVNSDVYDSVQENLNKAKDETDKSYNNFRNKADNVAGSFAIGMSEVSDQLNVVRDKALDAAAKENELLQNGYDRANADAQKIRSNVKDTLEEGKRLTY